MINIGAYIKGTNKKVDMAIEKIEAINDFLKQGVHDRLTFDEIVELLRGILD